MKHLGNAPTVPRGDSWVGLDDNGNLDTEKTSKNRYRLFTTSDAKEKIVKNFRPENAMKGTWEFNEYIMKLSKTVNDTFRIYKTDANKHLWETFDETRTKISVARAADHGPFVIDEAKEKLGDSIPLSKQDLGINPVTSKPQETVDWKKTVQEAIERGTPGATEKIRAFLNEFYTTNAARSHLQVVRSYKRVGDRNQTCRRS